MTDFRKQPISGIAASCQVITILWTWSLWNERSSPPNLPVIGSLSHVPWAPPLLLLAALTIVLPRFAAPAFCAVYLLAALGDQTRLQPEVVSLALLMTVPLYGDYGRSMARWHLTTMWLWAGATNDGYSEAAFNTDVANRVAALLRDAGATVVLTRDPSTPWGPCITGRAAIGNDAQAAAAISIHADGGPADGRGFHVIEPLPVAGHNEAIIEPSKQLALDVRDAYRAATGLPYSTYLGHDGLDARSDLGGLNLSTVPKVFIETGNMRNAADAAQLEDPAFRQKIAVGIADGLIRFVSAR